MEIVSVYIQHDYETSERAGAAGTFQVIGCHGKQENGTNVDLIIDAGIHFYSDQEVLEYLVEKFSEYNFTNTNIEKI